MPRHLVLIPTDLERRAVAPRLGGSRNAVELCGFGIAAAAARTAGLIAELRPSRVMLVGIAGSFGDRLPVGSAWRFDRVACHGIGVGSGEAFVSAEAMGWPQWPGDAADASSPVGDSIACVAAPEWPGPRADLLVTVATASGDAADARLRHRLVPDAAAEDMEGFGVALACRLAGLPITIVRGISNVAGDRDKARWRIAEALDAAGSLAARLLEEEA